jgi:hypothetical protein
MLEDKWIAPGTQRQIRAWGGWIFPGAGQLTDEIYIDRKIYNSRISALMG